jgi:hypothetical protein
MIVKLSTGLLDFLPLLAGRSASNLRSIWHFAFGATDCLIGAAGILQLLRPAPAPQFQGRVARICTFQMFFLTTHSGQTFSRTIVDSSNLDTFST